MLLRPVVSNQLGKDMYFGQGVVTYQFFLTDGFDEADVVAGFTVALPIVLLLIGRALSNDVKYIFCIPKGPDERKLVFTALYPAHAKDERIVATMVVSRQPEDRGSMALGTTR